MAAAVVVVIIIAAVAVVYLSTSGSPSGTTITSVSTTTAVTTSVTTSVVTSGENQTLIRAAEAEGSLTVYTALTPASVATALVNAFQAQYPSIQTNAVSLLTSQIEQKVGVEVNASKGVGDVVTVTGIVDMETLKAAGDFQAYHSPYYGNFSSQYIDGNYDYFVPAQFAIPLIYNTKLLNNQTAPKSWCDIGNPQYKGTTGISDPSLGGGAYLVTYALYSMCGGESFFKQQLANNSLKLESYAPFANDVTSGALAFAPTTDYIAEQQLAKGAPIAFDIPKEGALANAFGAGISKVAPHPNAARLFIDWLASPTGQNALQTIVGYVGTMKGLPPNALDPYGVQRAQWLANAAPLNATLMYQLFQTSLRTQLAADLGTK